MRMHLKYLKGIKLVHIARGKSGGMHFDIVSFEHWKCSARWYTEMPVTQAYRKMASCSSRVMCFESLIPPLRSN
jgi:hypothetical protein